MKKNKGFTLVELVVAISIVVIVGSGLAGFFQVSNRLFRGADEELNLQYEAQMAMNRIQNLILDGTGIYYAVGDSSYVELVNSDDEFSKKDEINVTKKTLYVIHQEEELMVSAIVWKKEDFSLSFWKQEYNIEMENEPSGHMLAQYIKDFHMDLTELEKRRATIGLVLETEGKSYEAQSTVALRNSIQSQ